MIKKGIYKHFRGNLYMVLDIARHSETEEEHVVYRAIKDDSLCIRPLSMFDEVIEHDGKTVKRFEFVEAAWW